MSRAIALDRWTACDVDPGAGEPPVLTTGLAISAPGDLYQALVAAGRLDHPFEGRNETEAAWVRDREWWWRTTFAAPDWSPDDDIALVFEGLDTFAEVFLDGVPLGRADNMFRSWRYDLAARVTPGATHQLAIRFEPTAKALEGRAPPPPWAAFTDRISRSKRNLMRKAQFGWGWDWGPDLPTVGVWRPARIEVRPRRRLDDVRFAVRSVSQQRADASVTVERSAAAQGAVVQITLTAPDGVVVAEQHAEGDGPIHIAIDHPRLWWTADLGDQPLYDLRVRLFDGDHVVDEIRRRVGLRTIALDQSPDPDEPGATFFRFVLNGEPLFAKGACWVPASSFVADVDVAAYTRLIDQTVGANMNMMRVWGGGIYEPDLFYDLCDAKGVLVWQDFMFACAPYPDDEPFVAAVRAEADEQVRRLRHHPCLALWCGNNENQAIHRINVDVSGVDTPLPGAILYDTVLPDLLATLDPDTPYWPGSPWGGANPNSMKAGDVHDWTVWHGVPPIPDDHMVEPFGFSPDKIGYQRYAEDTGRFISEFGIQAAPALATLERWMDPADLSPDSEGFEQRIKDEARKALAMIGPVTGPPASLQDYVDFTQWTQAEGLKFGIEHFRRRRPHCSGALLWQFNDCWPCVSWSLVDYDGVEKAAYHAVRRAFAPVLASFKPAPDGAVELWISNDTREPVRGEVTILLEGLDGAAIERWTTAYGAPAGGHATPWRVPLPSAPDRVLRALCGAARFEPARHFFAPIRDLKLSDGEPRVRVTRLGPNALRVELTSPVCLPFVHLTSARPDLRFSDNHFDLFPGDVRRIEITGAAPFGAIDLDLAWWRTDGRPGSRRLPSAAPLTSGAAL
ncbi:glycoside hydrolase family 2 protein [Caulobacter sp. RHG1]|uniref:glycoside hydrolase family 2 protein n=1 Tax=Caulobacter sp. (strain RHG1) TaxID=2545762 RepID=UPI001557CF1C|nr:glycoside hydrolase family 2 protein [Caulobacter sp. RHG1]NQE64443.1 Beta-mannosidase [Caulobacter sp. RHG1]